MKLIPVALMPLLLIGCIGAAKIQKVRDEVNDLRAKVRKIRTNVEDAAKLAKQVETEMPIVNAKVKEMAEADSDLEPFAEAFDGLTEDLIKLATKVGPPAEKILEALDEADEALERIDKFLDDVSKASQIWQGIRNTFVEAAGSTPLGKILAAGLGILGAVGGAAGKPQPAGGQA